MPNLLNVPPPDPLELELLGPLKFCCKCREYWPEDEEFFYRSQRGTFNSPCRACIEESRFHLVELPCVEPGCTEQRDSWRHARCKAHASAHRKARKQRRAEPY